MLDAVAWALVHFLWQGTALALLAWLLMRAAGGASIRYVIGVTTMAAMVAVIGLTVATLAPRGADPRDVRTPETGAPVLDATADTIVAAAVEPSPIPANAPFVLPTTWVLTIWAIGVCVLSLRVLGGWMLTRRVTREAAAPIAADLQRLAARVGEQLAIRRMVRVVESSRVAVPVMIGWLRPIVLIPPAALAGLTPLQIEAILAHEFAHIRRHDYLVNLLQTAVETLLFFHPAVWWLSREIRRERELCCDDLAVGVCDRLTYATALAALARFPPPSLALAATDGSLRDRIRRIVATSPSSESSKGGWMAMLPLALVVSLAAPSAFTQAPVPSPVHHTKVPEVPVEIAQATTVLPRPTPAPAAAPTVRNERVVPQATPTPLPKADPTVDQLLDEQLEIERRKIALDRSRLENEAALNLKRLELDVRNGELNIQEMRKKIAAGDAIAANQARNTEYSHQLLLSRLAMATRDLEISLEALAIREQELALRRRMQKAGLSQGLTRLSADTITLTGNASLDMSSGQHTLSASDVLRAGDRVTVRIAGEDQLPQQFTVAAAGTIRYPLLGAITVEGSTVAQVQAAVAKLLTDRRLLDNPRVTVTAVR